jgi:hypothetical protein
MAPNFLFMDEFYSMLNLPSTEFNDMPLKFIVEIKGARRDF